ncbi:hypothetical protein [Novosphingobium sp. TH158]|uniref:hypothetical protein n=1 Tax=Novosphingobium sp. TH158 TaxID=2067455 RepID=UPI000C7DF4E5|nr:hypothetical protein [Novosphingobium sp. TH158]PLK26119.1 hypothetical protein C0V78_03895 [Novosphingobium sp. TH158]
MRTALALAAALLASSPAFAAKSDPACPAGKLQRVRVSEIRPGGSLAGFREAFGLHARWYAQRGYRTDRLSMSPVVAENGMGRGRKGAVRVVTIHTGVSNVPREKQDAAWKAFVAKYKENSRIVSTTMTCTDTAQG